jgi:hypothetical protein
VSPSTLGTVSCMHVNTPRRHEFLGGRSLLKLKRDSAHMHRLSTRQAKTENHLSSRVDEQAQGVRRRIILSVKFKRKSTKLLSLSELTKLREDSEIEVSKGKVPFYGRRTNEICSRRDKVCCDRWIR